MRERRRALPRARWPASQHDAQADAVAKPRLKCRHQTTPGPSALEVHGHQQHGARALTRLGTDAQTTTEREPVRRLAKWIEEETGQDVHASARARAARRTRGIASEASAGGAHESQPHVDTERNLDASPDVYRRSITEDHIAPKLG